MEHKILIVEDDLVFRNYLYQVLKYDYDVTAAPGPLEAIEAIKQSPYSLMITDLRMPDMDGRALVEKVHGELDESMMVIVITAYEDDWPMDDAMSSNIFRYLRKGAFLPSELKQNVEKALEVRGSIVSLNEYKRRADISETSQEDTTALTELHKLIEERTHTIHVLESRLSKLTEHAKDMIVWLDGSCRCEYINAEAVRMLGGSFVAPVGRQFPWTDIIHPEDQPLIEKIKTLAKDKVYREEGEVRVYSGARSMLYLSYRIFMEYTDDNRLFGIGIVAEDITQQKVAEQALKNANCKIHEFNERLTNGVSQKIKALRESEERYKNIVEDSSDIIFSLDGDARILYMNRKGLQTLGMSIEAVSGIHCSSFIADEASQKKLREIIDMMGSSDYHEPFDLAIDTPAGRKIYRADLVKIGDKNKPETVCVAKDISEDIAKKKRLQLLANIEHYSADAIIGLDGNGGIISWNQGAHMIFGWMEEEAIGRDILIMVPEDGIKEAEAMLGDVRSKGLVKDHETKLRTKNGHVLDVTLTMTALRDESGEITGFSAIIMDLTEKTRMEAALIQTERLAAMGKLSASIAHEINNPLYGIRSCLNHVLNADKGNIDQQFVRLAIKETDRIADLIRNMKTFYQPNDGKVQSVDIHEVLREVFILNRKYLEENMVKLVFNPTGSFPIECMPEQIKQVFINIVTNAAEAMPDGGELSVETQQLEESQEIVVNFRDNGVGIARDDLPQIFDMFYSKKPMVKGVGLGLSVSYGIVKRHGGTMDVTSEEGKCTTVTVTLPVKPPFARQMQLDLK
jgi:PAS domain S-box-containing protein